MSNNDQQIIDHLYNAIYIQKLRCDQFYNGYQATNSVWNRYSDEKKILDMFVDKYKNFYKNKAEELKKKVLDIKEYNIKSYLTYDVEFYVNSYNTQIDEINNYISHVESKTYELIKKDKLNSISKDIDILFPGYLVYPSLFGVEY